MSLYGGFLLLSVFLGDMPTILAAAEVFGFMPTKVDRGEGTSGINVNPARLFDIAYSIHEKSSKFLREHRKEAEKTTSQPKAEITAYSDVRHMDTTDKSAFPQAENRSNVGNNSHMSLNNSTAGIKDTSDSAYQHELSNIVSSDFEVYDDIRKEDVIGYSECSEEGGDVICKYVSNYKNSEKHEISSETNTSATDSNVHQHSNYGAISNFDSIQKSNDAQLFAGVGISEHNNKSDNSRNIQLRNITGVLDTTEYLVHEKTTEVTITEPTEASTSRVPKEHVTALKDMSRSSVAYEALVQSSKTDSHRTYDYPLIGRFHHSDTSNQAYPMPLPNSSARNLCIACGPNAYCDTSQDPNVCVCYFGYTGTPPDCYQPSADHILHSYSMLLKRYSNDKVPSTSSSLTFNSKQQYTNVALQKNKSSTFPKA